MAEEHKDPTHSRMDKQSTPAVSEGQNLLEEDIKSNICFVSIQGFLIFEKYVKEGFDNLYKTE